MHTLRLRSPDVLARVAAALQARGFHVTPIVVPENPWQDGNPYLHTDAPWVVISEAWRDAQTL
jgi:hypothetical protein